jgi:uncharacterized membrane protein YuzA (DUF378 family)
MNYENRFIGVWSETYIKKLLFKISMILLIVGGLHCLLFGLFDVNIFSMFGKNFSTFIYVIIGTSALAIMFDRDTYLPFLGPMVIPCSVLENREPPGATKDVSVIVEPNVKIIYWAAEPASDNLKKINSWKNAYLDYQNAGVTTSNAEGVAVFKIRDPQSYKVPFKGEIPKHVHYRVCGEAGWIGKINTTFIDKDKVEGFELYKNIADKSGIF